MMWQLEDLFGFFSSTCNITRTVLLCEKGVPNVNEVLLNIANRHLSSGGSYGFLAFLSLRNIVVPVIMNWVDCNLDGNLSTPLELLLPFQLWVAVLTGHIPRFPINAFAEGEPLR